MSYSEHTFSARLARAQELLDALQGFSDYSPPQPEQTIAGFSALLQNIETVNRAKNLLEKDYRDAVLSRKKAFREDPISVIKILPLIRSAVLAQYGKDTVHFQEIKAIIKKMNDARAASSFSNGSVSKDRTQEKHRVSRSERSYGALAGYFQNIVDCLGKMPGYNPSNQILQKDHLADMADLLRNFSQNVNDAFYQLNLKRQERNELYLKLSRTVLMMKEYVKAQYGPRSAQYDLVKKIRV